MCAKVPPVVTINGRCRLRRPGRQVVRCSRYPPPVPSSVRPSTVLQIPPGSRLRPTATAAQLKLAVARAVIAQMTGPSEWSELALITDTEGVIHGHGRLLKSLYFGDDDYEACVHQVVPALLGLREIDPNSWQDGDKPIEVYVDSLPQLEEHLDLPGWLAANDPRLHRLLYAHDLAETAALDAAGAAAAALDLPEITRQLERLHRDLADDLPAAIGHAKDLVESACKTVLGHTGPGAGAKGPALVDAALRAVGRHPAQVDATDPDAQLLKQLLGSVTSQLHAVFGLRNRAGTGHGRAGDIPLDPALARLTIGTALHAVTYLLMVADQQATTSEMTDDADAPF